MNQELYLTNNTSDESFSKSEDANTENEAGNAEDRKSEKYEWRWVLVGNIVESHVYGENKETRYGTKQFTGGTKVFMAPVQWGDGYENIVVIGNARHSRQYIEIVTRSKYIDNFRIQKVYKPVVLSLMEKSRYTWWTNSDGDHDCIVSLSNSLNSWKNKGKTG